MQLSSIFSLLLFIISLPLVYSTYDSNGKYRRGDVNKRSVVNCHSHQATELGTLFKFMFGNVHNETCADNICMLLWGLTEDKTTRILAQGCAPGGMETVQKDSRPLQNECPGGGGVGPQPKPILMGKEGADILRTLTHIQICVCQSDFCNVAHKKDGESCEGDTSTFCNPLDSTLQPASASNYSVEAIPYMFPATTTTTKRTTTTTSTTTVHPISDAFTGSILPGYRSAQVVASPSQQNEEESTWWSTMMSWSPLLIIIVIAAVGALLALVYAILKKTVWKKSPDPRNRQASGHRLNSMTEITILTEVAQGYKQEGEDLIRESQAGGPHQIANWKFDDAVKLGEGSFGAVYKVEMKHEYLVDYKVAALKTFSHKRSTHFFNESKTLKYVHDFKFHPNIIQYLGRAVDCRETLDVATWRIALELCEGGCVREWITCTHITMTQYLEAANGLLSALTYLHNEDSIQTSLSKLSNFRGNSTDSGNPDSRSSRRSSKQNTSNPAIKKKLRIAHCDINSRNILVRNPITGNVVLADFGLALTDNQKRQEEVQIREIGTIRYLAPEMLQSLINLGDKLGSLVLVDTYATGLVLWELLSRTVELYEDDREVPEYAAPYEKELNETEADNVNRFDAMLNVVVRRGSRPEWGGIFDDLKAREEEATSRDEESDLTEIERFIHASVLGIDSMLHRDPEARMTIPHMAEKVDTYRLKRQRVLRTPVREAGDRDDEDSLLEENTE